MDLRRLDTWITLVSVVLIGWFFFREPGPWLRACFGWLWEWAAPQPSIISEADEGATEADEQTDEQTDVGVSAESAAFSRLQVDRTRAAIIDTLVECGWTATDMRGMFRGDNNAIAAEVAAARQRLGLVEAERTITVRDHAGERQIAWKG